MTFSISKIQGGSQNLLPKLNAFCIVAKFKMAGKKWRQSNFCEMSQYTLQIRCGLKFHQNRSISNRFQDKCVIAFYAEIQNGCQKWQESDFCEKSPVDSDNLQVRNLVKITISNGFPDKCVFAFYAEIQDGCQKWWESDFLRKVVSRLCRQPVGPKFRQNHSISHRFQDKMRFCVLHRNSRSDFFL